MAMLRHWKFFNGFKINFASDFLFFYLNRRTLKGLLTLLIPRSVKGLLTTIFHRSYWIEPIRKKTSEKYT
ncbi:hypothetical protein DRF67_11885 [Chryseobacterium pennipullorum]|uniref:Uncharacterized protein n=1 Tax=Chryseobacterium pennipullorum TaxID=2258963 RepID=A0A3D9B1V4_9FLAO|nr:hypothetical protein DRF67_11885 [Chryseobacterium pennipullorum]